MLIVRGLLAAFLFAAIPFAVVEGLSQEPSPQAPQVKSKQQSDSGLKTQDPNDQQTEIPQHPPSRVDQISRNGGERERGTKTNDDTKQGTEFWPPFYGYRLKVTDTLLVAVTLLLFFATLALWLSTRRLVTGAENSAIQQLRAYVFAAPVHGNIIITKPIGGSTITVRFEIKNWGMTPAYRIRNASLIRRMPWPMPDDYKIEFPEWDDRRHVTLAPKQSMFNNASVAYEKLPSSERFYAFGVIEYFHAFSGKKRTTKYCVSVETSEIIAKALVAATTGTFAGESDIMFYIAPQHNEAD